MSFESKGSSDATGLFKDALDRSRGGPLRDRDQDPPFNGGFGKTVDANEIFEGRRDALPDPERKSGDPDARRAIWPEAIDGDVAEAAEGHLKNVVATAMRDPEVRKAVIKALLSYDEDASAVAEAEAEQAAVDAYAKSPGGNWIR